MKKCGLILLVVLIGSYLGGYASDSNGEMTSKTESSYSNDGFTAVKKIKVLMINYYGISSTYETTVYHKDGTGNEYYNYYLQGPRQKYFQIERNTQTTYGNHDVSSYKFMCRAEHLNFWFN